MITAAELVALVAVRGADEAALKLATMGGAVDSAGAKLGMLAAGATVLAGAALIGIGVASAKMAGDFQQNTNMLVTSAGEIRSNLELVRAGILKMSVDTATSTKELINGMYMIESAGYHGAAGLKVLQASAEGAKAENASLKEVANAVTSALNAYHLSANDATWVTNDLVAAVGAGKMKMQDLAVALKNVLPVSATFKISLTDTTAAIATMTAVVSVRLILKVAETGSTFFRATASQVAVNKCWRCWSCQAHISRHSEMMLIKSRAPSERAVILSLGGTRFKGILTSRWKPRKMPFLPS